MSTETPVTTEAKKRGRKVVEGSARQARLAARQARAAQGLSTDKGRPVDPNSARQKRLAERQAKLASGVEIKRGAPKKVKAEAPAA
jgi:hypothetical protein